MKGNPSNNILQLVCRATLIFEYMYPCFQISRTCLYLWAVTYYITIFWSRAPQRLYVCLNSTSKWFIFLDKIRFWNIYEALYTFIAHASPLEAQNEKLVRLSLVYPRQVFSEKWIRLKVRQIVKRKKYNIKGF